MRAVAYVQVVPKYDRRGKCIGIRCASLTGKAPREPQAGAMLLRLDVRVPDRAFNPVDVAVNVPEDACRGVAVVSAEVAESSRAAGGAP